MLQGGKVSVQSTVELQPLERHLYLTYMIRSFTKKKKKKKKTSLSCWNITHNAAHSFLLSSLSVSVLYPDTESSLKQPYSHRQLCKIKIK